MIQPLTGWVIGILLLITLFLRQIMQTYYYLVFTDQFNTVYGTPNSFYLHSNRNASLIDYVQADIRGAYPEATVTDCIFAEQISNYWCNNKKKKWLPYSINGIRVIDETEYSLDHEARRNKSFVSWLKEEFERIESD